MSVGECDGMGHGGCVLFRWVWRRRREGRRAIGEMPPVVGRWYRAVENKKQLTFSKSDSFRNTFSFDLRIWFQSYQGYPTISQHLEILLFLQYVFFPSMYNNGQRQLYQISWSIALFQSIFSIVCWPPFAYDNLYGYSLHSSSFRLFFSILSFFL